MEKDQAGLQPVSFALPRDLAVRIRVLAAKQDMSRSRFVRNVLEEVLRCCEQAASRQEVNTASPSAGRLPDLERSGLLPSEPNAAHRCQEVRDDCQIA